MALYRTKNGRALIIRQAIDNDTLNQKLHSFKHKMNSIQGSARATITPPVSIVVQTGPVAATAGYQIQGYNITTGTFQPYLQVRIVTNGTDLPRQNLRVTAVLWKNTVEGDEPSPFTFSPDSTPTVFTNADGLAIFGNLKVNKAGVYRIAYYCLDEAGNRVDFYPTTDDDRSSPFVIYSGQVKSVALIQQPPSVVTVGQVVTPALQTQIYDEYGNPASLFEVIVSLNKGGFSSGTLSKINNDGSPMIWDDLVVGNDIWTAKDFLKRANWYGIAMSSDGKYQSAVAYGGQIYISRDYGNTWTPKDSNRIWYDIAMSSDGKYQSATVSGGLIYISNDYGNTWTAKESNRNWFGIAMSSDGKYQTATVVNGQIYISRDYGNTWTAKDSNRSWSAIAMSSDGKYQSATVYNSGQIYISNDYGNTWTPKESDRNWRGIAMSSDGKYQSATFNGGQIYISSDYGNTWTPKESNRNWYGIAMSSDGKYQSATVVNGQIYISNDYGNTWTPKDSNREWYFIAMSSDGKYQSATAFGGQIYTYVNFPATDVEMIFEARAAGRPKASSTSFDVIV